MADKQVRAAAHKAIQEAVEWGGSFDEARPEVRAAALADTMSLYELQEAMEAAEGRE